MNSLVQLTIDGSLQRWSAGTGLRWNVRLIGAIETGATREDICETGVGRYTIGSTLRRGGSRKCAGLIGQTHTALYA